MTAFVQGRHRYLVPTLPDRGPDGRGRADTWDWPPTVEEVDPALAAGMDIDVVVLQRPMELDLAAAWLGGRRPGRDVAAIYVEHNAPQGNINEMRHVLAGQSDIAIAHVSHFNQLFWDCDGAPTFVIEHGVIDPGHQFTAELPRAAAAINEARRRARVSGTDVLLALQRSAPIDLFGMDAEVLGGIEVTQQQLHRELGRRRAYVHPFRWTSLGLTLIEAMMLGLPVVCLATTEAPEAVPPDAGFVSNRLDVLAEAVRRLVAEPELGRVMGDAGRAWATERYDVKRFLADWDDVLLNAARH
jgi:glycosyltransferase involved in cell wall biosynthesis